MKTLHLLRHAKSSWDSPGTPDIERPLNERGRSAARAMAGHLAAAGIRPALVLCSAARRTRETLDALAEALAGAEILVERELYETTHVRLLERLRRLPDSLPDAMLIGHNPGMERLARLLCGTCGAPEALARLETKFPTGALATLTSPVGRWAELGAGTCRLDSFVRPADLSS